MCWPVKSFCCYISLEVGAQIISIVITLLTVLITVLYSSAAIMLKLSQTKFIFYAVMALTSGLLCVCGILLSFGAFQRRSGFMWPWLIVAWLTGFGLLTVAVAGTMVLILDRQLSADVNVVIFAYMVYSVFLLYCACVVNGRRKELVKEREYIDSANFLMQRTSATAPPPKAHPNAWRYV